MDSKSDEESEVEIHKVKSEVEWRRIKCYTAGDRPIQYNCRNQFEWLHRIREGDAKGMIFRELVMREIRLMLQDIRIPLLTLFIYSWHTKMLKLIVRYTFAMHHIENHNDSWYAERWTPRYRWNECFLSLLAVCWLFKIASWKLWAADIGRPFPRAVLRFSRFKNLKLQFFLLCPGPP